MEGRALFAGNLLNGIDPINNNHHSVLIPQRLERKLHRLFDQKVAFDGIWIKSRSILRIPLSEQFQIDEDDDLSFLSRKPVCPKKRRS